MIQVTPVRNDISGQKKNLRTHILSPRLGVTLTLTIEGSRENIVSILEDHILETISAVEWNSPDSDQDFTYLTESYNRFIRNLEPADLAGISVVLSFLKDNFLTISAIGSATAFLMEGDEVSQISVPERGRFDFHALTTGEVSRNASIYLSNKNLHEVLGDEWLYDFSEMNAQEFGTTAKEIFAREIDFPFHLIRISHSFKAVPKQIRDRGRGQLDLIKNKSADVVKKVASHPVWKNAKQRISEKIESVDFVENKNQKYAFLGIGAVLVFVLLYSLFSAISGAFLGSADAGKDKILQAQALVEEAQKLTSDQLAFENNISQAEKILSELRAEKKYLSDVETIQASIDVAKKEVYGIEIIDLAKKESIIPLTEGLEPISTFEINNKLMIIGKTGMISGYIRGGELPKILTYPANTSAINADSNDAGVPYIISESANIMTKRQDNIVNVSLTGQEAWEVGTKMREFNGNLYLLNAEKTQIYKHKPSANGFSAKTNVLNVPSSTKILDFAIDGGFYILLEDGKIGRYLSTKADAGVTGLVLNQIPGGWNIDGSLSSEIVASERLSYVYIRNGKRVWIFQPNSRKFQDVNALTYVAQIEIQSEDEVVDISIPRDGLLYISTPKGVFETQFEVKDGKFYLKMP